MLSAQWSAPEGVQVENWTVRCYNDNGFDETTVVTDLQASFNITDLNSDYTVEVTAEGMSVSERAFAPANSLEIKGLKAEGGFIEYDGGEKFSAVITFVKP
jgi:hypothetical protein